MKRVFIVHGWEGLPEHGWFPWLKAQLEQRGFEVHVPAMPNTDIPVIEEWVPFLRSLVGTCDENTYFVGHSIGCQTILRYFETVERAGGAVFLGGFVNLHMKPLEEEDAVHIAQPWLDAPIHWEKIKVTGAPITAIFSDNDKWVPADDAEIFKGKLGAKTIVQHDMRHFSHFDGFKELPIALEELLLITGS